MKAAIKTWNLQKFGLLEKTGINLPGEANSIFIAQNKYDSSIHTLHQCIQINPNYADAYFYLAAS